LVNPYLSAEISCKVRTRALSQLVSFIDEMDSSCDLVGISCQSRCWFRAKEEPIMSNDTRIAVDVAKAVFEIAISDRPGHVTRRERLPRAQFLAFMAQLPKATVIIIVVPIFILFNY